MITYFPKGVPGNLLEKHLKLDLNELKDFLKERYFEQIVPIVFAEDSSIYYDLIIE